MDIQILLLLLLQYKQRQLLQLQLQVSTCNLLLNDDLNQPVSELLLLLLPQPVIPTAITAANVMAISCFFIMCSSKFFVFYVTFARSGILFVRPD